MFTYKNNQQIFKQVKCLYVLENVTEAEVANKAGLSRQNFNQILRRKRLAFCDVQRILDILGYDMEINFKKRENEE